MIFTHRPMQPEDIPESVKIMAPSVFGPRYGRDIDLLPKAALPAPVRSITAVFRSAEDARAQ